MFKIASLVVLVVLVVFSISGSVTAQQIESPQEKTKFQSHYNIKTYATYLGLSLEQYSKFHAAISGRIKAVNEGPGFELKKQPSYIQAVSLLKNNEEIPESLLEELSKTLNNYNIGMAKYAGVSIDRYETITKEFSNLSIILDDLKIAGRDSAQNSKFSGSASTLSAEEDEIEHIVIHSTQSKIDTTSSGGFTSLVFAIQSAGINRMGPNQVSGSFTVKFISTDTNRTGTQTFQVTQSYAWPTGTFKCNSEVCALVPF